MENYISITPSDVPLGQIHDVLLSAVSPRPIAFVSTIDSEGRPNLAPFSYFNVFSTRPPILIIGPNRSGRTAKNKDTVLNIQETFEAVINVVNFENVEKMNVAGAEFPHGVNEFEKAGFTALPSELVKPFRVAESPVQIECKVMQLISLGAAGGAGNLILCEAVRIHFHKKILGENGKINPEKIDLVARMGQNWYSRARDGLFEVLKPSATQLYGFDRLPDSIKQSKVLTGNQLGKLCNVAHLPDVEEVASFYEAESRLLLQNLVNEEDFHQKAAEYLAQNHVATAWLVLLSYLYLHNIVWLR